MRRRILAFGLVAGLVISTSTALGTDRLVPSVYPTIQAGIDAAGPGDTVIIAENVYTGAGNRDVDFGGKVITVRSADPNNPAVVAATVIDCQSSARGFYFHSGETASSVLAGLTISNGYADNGGGVRCEGSSPTIRNCVFSGNAAEYDGGGVGNEGCSPTVTGCVFTGNSAANSSGGGVCNYNCSSLMVTNCVFTGNTAYWGGGIENWESSTIVTNCIFAGNTASLGGGIGNWDGSPTIVNCTFNGNSADNGGGIESFGDSNPDVSNCILWGDSASDGPEIHGDCSISYSDVEGGHAGAGNIDADPCFIDAAGGDYHLQVDSPCIDSGTNSPTGGLPETDIDGDPRVMGWCVDMGADEFPMTAVPVHVLVPNGGEVLMAGEVYTIRWESEGDVSEVVIEYSINNGSSWIGVDPPNAGNSGSYDWLVPTVNSNLCLVRVSDADDPSAPDTSDDVFAIEATEPAIIIITPESGPQATYMKIEGTDFGVTPNEVLFDGIASDDIVSWGDTAIFCRVPEISGQSSVEVHRVDGAVSNSMTFTVTTSDTIHVDLTNTTGIENGTTNFPFSRIQRGIDAAGEGAEVVVKVGTYAGDGNRDIDFGGRTITVRSVDPNHPGIVANTIIDCNGSDVEPHRGFHFHNGEDGNSVLAGLTITNGYAPNDVWDERWFPAGGGIYCDTSSPTINNCRLINNYSNGKGGGIYCGYSSAQIIGCTITNNIASYGEGGGIALIHGNPKIDKCEIIGNGISTGNNRGALYLGKCNAQVTNSFFTGNKSQWCIYCGYSGNYTITNCTIVRNRKWAWGSAIHCKGATTTVANCICRDNSYGGDGNREIKDATSVTYTNVEGGLPGEGNIDADPCFVSGPDGDYYLSQIAAGQAVDSPCVDAGSDTAVSLCMDQCTTRTDGANDVGVVNMGYHYGDCHCGSNVADLDDDLDVDFVDYAILAGQWLEEPGVPSADIAPEGGDGIVNESDLAILVDEWLWGL
jgi:hypothetical protein